MSGEGRPAPDRGSAAPRCPSAVPAPRAPYAVPGPRARSTAPAPEPAPSRVRLIVCGEPSRGDDGLGPAAVDGALARLPAAVRDRVEVRRRTVLDPLDLVDGPAGTALLVVDCVVGVPPGELVRLPLDALGGRAGPPAASSHTLPLADVLGLARIVAGRPIRGVFLGLGGADFRVGAPLGPAVAARLPALEAAVAAEIEALLAAAGLEAAGFPVSPSVARPGSSPLARHGRDQL